VGKGEGRSDGLPWEDVQVGDVILASPDVGGVFVRKSTISLLPDAGRPVKTRTSNMSLLTAYLSSASDDDNACALLRRGLPLVVVIGNHGVGPTEDPLGCLVAHIHAAVAVRADEIVVPVGPVNRVG